MESKKVPKGYHRMPNGKLMKNSAHKKSENDFRDSEVKRKQYRLWDRDAQLMNWFAEQEYMREYMRRKPKSGYDKPKLPPKATVGPDTGRTGKNNKPVKKTVYRRPLKGPKRDKVIEVQPYPRTRRRKPKYYM